MLVLSGQVELKQLPKNVARKAYQVADQTFLFVKEDCAAEI